VYYVEANMEIIHKTFDKCPACGSDKRFVQTLVEIAKDRGLARENWKMFFDSRRGYVLDQNRVILMPIGSKVPAFQIATDICMECGCIYAVGLAAGEGTIKAEQLPPFTPAELPLSS